MHPSVLSVEQTLADYATSAQGLPTGEAAQRLRHHGPNLLHETAKIPLWREIIRPFTSVFVIVLLVAIGLSLYGHHLVDAAIIGVVVLVNALIEWYQAFTAKSVLNSLKKYDAKQVTIRRDGAVIQLDIASLVPGDIVLISEGDRVPADGRLIVANNLAIDESSLTGESLPVTKQIRKQAQVDEVFNQKNMLFRGTTVTAGRGELCVTATGMETEFGRIADLAESSNDKAPLQIKLDRLARQIVGFAAVVAAATLGLGLLRGYPIDEMLRFALAITVATVPEGLPVALTIVFLLGIKRMAQQKAFIRRMAAVETLGAVTLIATDKTGTLTQNQLHIGKRWPFKRRDLATAATLAVSRAQHITDPIDLAFAALAAPKQYQELEELPFRQHHRLSAVLWQTGATYEAYVKGAPESLLQRSTITAAEHQHVSEEAEFMAALGYRVLGLARKRSTRRFKLTPDHLKQLEFIGLIGLSDTIRPDAAAAVRSVQRAGVRVMMLTGDHPTTATSIAHDVHIAEPRSHTLTGNQIEGLPAAQLLDQLAHTNVVARVLPEHKYDMVQALRTRHVVAMTGDGVNDAPALVEADIGISMGSGTDTAKEASDMVLLDNSFATIIRAIREGRTIYANVRKMVFYLFSATLGEITTMIGALLIGLPLPLTAVQILWINLVTDGAVVIPLGLEPHEAQHMRRPPRRRDEPLLSRPLLWRIGLIAGLVAALALGIFAWYLSHDPAQATTMAFFTLVVAQWANALNARSETASVLTTFRRPNWKLWAGLAIAAGLQLALMLEPFKSLFGLVSLGLTDAAVLAGAFVLIIAAADLHKRLSR